MPKKLTLLDVKEALKDGRFRDSLPRELQEDVVKFLDNPGCACNVPLYRKLVRDYPSYLKAYFPDVEVADEAEETARLAKNHWTVINCSIQELESRLRMLPPGRKQVAVARWQDQATVIVNELDVLY